jgi:hypothetical protein
MQKMLRMIDMENHDTIARAVRMEIDSLTGDVYLVFKVVDESFKKRVREDWDGDVELEVLGKDLIKRS